MIKYDNNIYGMASATTLPIIKDEYLDNGELPFNKEGYKRFLVFCALRFRINMCYEYKYITRRLVGLK